MSEVSQSLSTEKTHKALAEICDAIASLHRAKNLLNNYHYQSKMVDDYTFLLNNIGNFCAPSDDAHEVIFAQLEASKQTLRDAESGVLWENVKGDLSKAYNATDKAWETIKNKK